MSLGLVTAFYIVAAILFILALGGLSNQEKAKQAIWYAIVGMALAVIATMFSGSGHFWLLIPWWRSAASAAGSPPAASR